MMLADVITRVLVYVIKFTGDLVTVSPDVFQVDLGVDAEFVLLASDGLWDYMNSSEAVSFVREQLRKHGNAQMACEALGQVALDRRSQDNITIVIADLGRTDWQSVPLQQQNLIYELGQAFATIIAFVKQFGLQISLEKMARSWSLEGSVKLKNLFGYGDLWDGSLIYGWDQMSEVSAGVSLPRFNGLVTRMMARVSLLSQDWLKFSSYKEQSLGLSLGLISATNHDVAYNLS